MFSDRTASNRLSSPLFSVQKLGAIKITIRHIKMTFRFIFDTDKKGKCETDVETHKILFCVADANTQNNSSSIAAPV